MLLLSCAFPLDTELVSISKVPSISVLEGLDLILSDVVMFWSTFLQEDGAVVLASAAHYHCGSLVRNLERDLPLRLEMHALYEWRELDDKPWQVQVPTQVFFVDRTEGIVYLGKFVEEVVEMTGPWEGKVKIFCQNYDCFSHGHQVGRVKIDDHELEYKLNTRIFCPFCGDSVGRYLNLQDYQTVDRKDRLTHRHDDFWRIRSIRTGEPTPLP